MLPGSTLCEVIVGYSSLYSKDSAIPTNIVWQKIWILFAAMYSLVPSPRQTFQNKKILLFIWNIYATIIFWLSKAELFAKRIIVERLHISETHYVTNIICFLSSASLAEALHNTLEHSKKSKGKNHWVTEQNCMGKWSLKHDFIWMNILPITAASTWPRLLA